MDSISSEIVLFVAQVPLAPFLALSFGTGVFSLLPYFALWEPLSPDEQKLLPRNELVRTRSCIASQADCCSFDRAHVKPLQASLLHVWDEECMWR